MTCTEIISKLLMYQLRLINVLDLNGQTELNINVSSEYSYITIEIMKSGEQYAHITFKVDDEAGTLSDIYCRDNTINEWISGKINPETWPGWASPTDNLPFSDEVVQSLQTAESIAALTSNCATGDNYRPGNFSKVSLNSERIELRQINHMNAKSLDHKHDYSLRNLVFTIPFKPEKTKKKQFRIHQIGNMIVEFSDNSSENNRRCGHKVIEALNKLG